MYVIFICCSWSKIGRLRRSKMPRLQAGAGGMADSTFQERAVLSGRLCMDTYLSSKELLREKNYRLEELARTQLKIKRMAEIPSETYPLYFSSSQKLMELIRYCENDSYLALSLAFKLNVLPLTKQLTQLSGNLWSRYCKM